MTIQILSVWSRKFSYCIAVIADILIAMSIFKYSKIEVLSVDTHIHTLARAHTHTHQNTANFKKVINKTNHYIELHCALFSSVEFGITT